MTYTPTTSSSPVYGQSGSSVSALQTQLNTAHAGDANYTPLAVDGKYGPLTQGAVNYKPTTPTQSPISTAFNPDLGTPANDPYPAIAKAGAEDTPNEDQIYSDTLGRAQSQIDATKAIYADQLAKARTTGISALGSGRAAEAASGNLGTVFGNAQTGKINDNNTAISGAITDQENAAVGALMGKVSQDALNEYNTRKTAVMTSAKAYSDYLAAQPAKLQQNLSDLGDLAISKGITDVKQISPSDLQAIASKYGVTGDQIGLAISNAATKKKAADAATEKASQYTLTEGEAKYDANGNRIAYNPKTYDPKTAADAKALVPSDIASINKQNPLLNLSYGETTDTAKAAIATANSISQGLQTAYKNPSLVRNGYYTYQYINDALNNLPSGISRTGFLSSIKDKLSLGTYRGAKNYGISKGEYDTLTS